MRFFTAPATRIKLFAAVSLGCALLLSGCFQSEHAELALTKAAATSTGAAATTSVTMPPGTGKPTFVANLNAPALKILPLVDQRADPSFLGHVGGRKFTAVDSRVWVEDEIHALVATRYQLVDPATTERVLTIEPTLRKLYVDSISIRKSAVVVLEVKVTPVDKPSWQAYYRGQLNELNWYSGKDEVTTNIKAALTDCLRKVQADLEARAHLVPAGT